MVLRAKVAGREPSKRLVVQEVRAADIDLKPNARQGNDG